MIPSKDPILAGILSLLIPGVGQIYCREWGRGTLFLGGAILVALMTPPIGALLSFAIWIWSIVDAYRIAKAVQGYSPGGEGPVIDINRFRLPSLNLRAALPYIGIPLAIVVVLAAVAAYVFTRRVLWRDPTSSSSIKTLVGKIKTYRAETGSYPDSLQMLVDPMDPIEKKQTLDPWGNPLIYRSSATGFELLSAGKDGRPGTEDDLTYHP